MALTNLTFGDGTNKALLCGLRPFMRALVAQLHSPSEDLVQVSTYSPSHTDIQTTNLPLLAREGGGE